MKKRKVIGFITSIPETVYGQRSLEGMMTQCKKYGYNIAVFASLVHVSGEKNRYLEGELNIYELPDFDMLDAVIIDSIPLTEDKSTYLTNMFVKKLGDLNKPVLALSLPVGNFETVHNDDSRIFYEITEHLLDVHKFTDIYFLTGHKGDIIAEGRLNAFKEIMGKRGLTVDESSVFYGNFWYSAGYDLADRIISGQVRKPQAVICASDHMAIGLVNRLKENGINIPGDIVVTGFEAVQEALLNDISITTFESNAAQTAADAVDIIRSRIEPGAQIIPYNAENGHIHTGMSCGCVPDAFHSYKEFKNCFYYLNHDFVTADPFANVDIGLLMEGYVPETLMGTSSPAECLKEIHKLTYLMRPYSRFFLCLKKDWLDMDKDITSGYPEKVKLAVMTENKENSGFFEDEDSIVFDTKLMLPQLWEESEEPSVFYFTALHFQDKVLGYAVLNKSMSEQKINVVYRNWIRFVSLSLEMSRAKNRLLKLSAHDEMTGAYNRRGMNMQLEEMLGSAVKGDKIFVSVIDMDGLKYINDNFGHEEGDIGIKLISRAADTMTDPGEICVRAGGDEFYVIGRGDYNDEKLQHKVDMFNAYIENKGKALNKPYMFSASIGYAIAEYNDDFSIEELISIADVDMYRHKLERRLNRGEKINISKPLTNCDK